MSEELQNHDEQPDLDARKKKQGQMLLIIGVAMILIVGGLVYFSNSLGKKKPEKENTLTDLDNMMPPEAKNKKRNLNEKYGRDYDRKLSDENYEQGVSDLTESQPIYKRKSNENLTDEDFEDIRKASRSNGSIVSSGNAQRNTNNKQALNQQNQRAIRNANAQIAYHANPETPMFKKSPEELREERLAELERENNAAMTQQVLAGLERASNAQQQPQNLNANGSDLPAPNNRRATAPRQAAKKEVGLQNNSAENTIARATETGFYSHTTALTESFSNDNSFIPAVVHGNGDGIKVSNGSNVKLRLLSETYLMVAGQKRVLPRSTLINGTVRISQDRVNIIVNAIRIDNNLIPVQMVTYDIDGSQGLYIPNLMDKNLLARELAEAGSRPMQGSIWTQGSFQQQVGTQIATESARSLMQGASQYARRKMNQVRVTIKPNYKVLLTTGSLENTENTESITSY